MSSYKVVMDVESLRLQSFGDKNSYNSTKGKKTRFFPKSQNKKKWKINKNFQHCYEMQISKLTSTFMKEIVLSFSPNLLSILLTTILLFLYDAMNKKMILFYLQLRAGWLLHLCDQLQVMSQLLQSRMDLWLDNWHDAMSSKKYDKRWKRDLWEFSNI